MVRGVLQNPGGQLAKPTQLSYRSPKFQCVPPLLTAVTPALSTIYIEHGTQV